MSEKKKKGYVVGALFQDKAVTKNSLIIPAVLVGGRKKKHTEGRNVHMGVRVVIPNMSKTFGALHYAGEGEAVTWNIYGEDVKGNFYTFFADVLRGEVVEALVIGANGSQPFEFGEAVVLENPSIIARSHETRSDGMNNLLLMADGIYRESDVCLEDKPDDGSVDELVEEYLVKHGYSIMKRDE